MHLHILGSGDAFGSGGRAQTCFLIDLPGERLLIDCGATSLPALQRAGVALPSIDAVAITHFHGDHFGGVPWLLLSALHMARNPRGLTIAGPPGVEARVLDTLDALFPGSRPAVERAIALEHLARFIEYSPGVSFTLGQATLTAVTVRHSESVACHGLRVASAGKVFAYSGDTEWTDTLVDLAEGADVLLLECQAWDGTPRGHLAYTTLRDQLARLRARQILLTHMGPAMLARAAAIGPRVSCADDGLRLAL